MDTNETIGEPEQPAQPQYEVRASSAAKVNLADFQNAVPLLREIRVANNSDGTLTELVVQLSSEPAFVRPRVWRIDAIATKGEYRIKDVDVQLDGALLSRLTESETATLVFTLSTQGAVELARSTHSIELLPRNHWGGLSHLPDMIAAFVQPNDPAIDRLLKSAAEVLRKNGRSAALDGYKGGSKRAWDLASSIWSAVGGLGIDYSFPPASFEHQGQKVRGPSQVLDARIATCLDLSLLFAAALEQAGLNPLVVFTKGHAFVGVWLKQEEFSSSVVDDVTALRKRIRLKELVLFETTLVTQRPAVNFGTAVDNGAGQIAEDKEDSFELAVDIRRARLQRIKPLASAESPTAGGPDTGQSTQEPPFQEAPDLPDDQGEEVDTPTLEPRDRLARWQRKLLDLSLRNNLLNFRAGKRALRLEAPDPGALEDLMSEGQALKLLARPDLMDGADPRNQAIYEGRSREDLRRAHALDALKRREVFVSLDEKELEVRLVELFRTARTTLQEGGANTLYLAIGFLTWSRERGGPRHKAPLILVPVTLARKSARSGFTFSLHEDEPRFNPTLLEMLRQDFHLRVGVEDGELPRDENGLDVAATWNAVSAAIRDIPGWEVTDDVVLSMFSFAKYLMWKDLAERTDQLRENAVVRHLIDTPRDPYRSDILFPNPARLDVEYGPEQTFCPLPADSSQLSAVMAAAKGKDFVLIGPPGTGKSQTISNLIAQCLAENKRVLFVSEKIAALDVVYRRLREAKLGEFCLELHSSKARKVDVLAQLQEAWEAQGDVDSDEWREMANKLARQRQDLNVYVQRLHQKHSNGLSIYSAIGILLAGEGMPPLELSWPHPDSHSRHELEAMRELVERVGVNARVLGPEQLTKGPLTGVGRSEWSPAWQKTFIDSARAVLPSVTEAETTAHEFLATTGLPKLVLDRRSRAALATLATHLTTAAGRDWSFALRPDARALMARVAEGLQLVSAHASMNSAMSQLWADAVVSSCEEGVKLLADRVQTHRELGVPWPFEVVEDIGKGLKLLDQIGEATRRLSVTYTEGVEGLNVHQLARDWRKAEESLWPLSWLRKRAVTKRLGDTVSDNGAPNVAEDLRLLVRIRDLRQEAGKIDIGPITEGVWAGLKTKPDLARTAVKFQVALTAARANERWSEDGLDSIATGRCGARLAKDMERMQRIRTLDSALGRLTTLSSETRGLWGGLPTDTARLRAALDFISARAKVVERGPLPGDHADIASGKCGPELTADYKRLQQRATLEAKLQQFDDLKAMTGGLWCGLDTDAALVDLANKFCAGISSAVANMALTAGGASAVQDPLRKLLGESNALLDPAGPVAAAGKNYINAWSHLQSALNALTATGSMDDQAAAQLNDLDLGELNARMRLVISGEPRLNAWCAWRKARGESIAAGLAALVGAIETGGIELSSIKQVFDSSYCKWWLNAVVENEPVIRGFVSAEHEKRIVDFRALDQHFIDLTRQWVRASLCADLPRQDAVSRNSEWGVLRHEISKKTRHLPLRELMGRIPGALTKLTPCLLMSPLSIAQYLAADATAFDVVVFDEASQIPVWDAVGAIARGKQVVMVGDPKQLPPTNFFDRAESSADDEDVEADLESILDECMGASLPTMNLSWHYRSRSESLIAFSNHRYYGGGLVTFPSPATDDRAVSFHHVTGIYEKGGARINKPEARAVVADIVARLKTPGFEQSGLTIGVVTFNSEQMTLIMDLLDEERRKDPALEPYFDEATLEPLFVKNLESVQGDERDIMYFSITYGPDLTGAVSMNFGPMNRDGGERRLNVAITRARQELRVFSSLRAEQMDLARTPAIGVRDLKHFLEFAERGAKSLAEANKGSVGDFESPFEEAVAAALSSKGWRAHTQIGVSAFRIDLAVVHPDAPGIYLAGVECDGATYHRSATARDRDMLREQVLRGLGWQILRVWSTDWWIDKASTLEILHKRLEDLLAASRADRARRDEAEAAASAANAAIQKAQEGALLRVAPLAAPIPSQAVLQLPQEQATRGEGVEIAMYLRNVSGAPARIGELVEADPLTVAGEEANAERFFDSGYDTILRRMIEHVVHVEGPVLDAVVARRIARAHGWQRTGGRIQDRVEQLARTVCDHTEEDVGTFYWSKGKTQLAVMFRSSPDASIRTVDEICLRELVALAEVVRLSSHGAESQLNAMARELGLSRLRAATRLRLEKAINQAGGCVAD